MVRTKTCAKPNKAHPVRKPIAWKRAPEPTAIGQEDQQQRPPVPDQQPVIEAGGPYPPARLLDLVEEDELLYFDEELDYEFSEEIATAAEPTPEEEEELLKFIYDFQEKPLQQPVPQPSAPEEPAEPQPPVEKRTPFRIPKLNRNPIVLNFSEPEVSATSVEPPQSGKRKPVEAPTRDESTPGPSILKEAVPGQHPKRQNHTVDWQGQTRRQRRLKSANVS